MSICETGLLLDCLIVYYIDRIICFFFQAEDGIRDLVRSRGLGDVYKRQGFIFILHLQDMVFGKMLLKQV